MNLFHKMISLARASKLSTKREFAQRPREDHPKKSTPARLLSGILLAGVPGKASFLVIGPYSLVESSSMTGVL